MINELKVEADKLLANLEKLLAQPVEQFEVPSVDKVFLKTLKINLESVRDRLNKKVSVLEDIDEKVSRSLNETDSIYSSIDDLVNQIDDLL